MEARKKVTAFLLMVGTLLAILPLSSHQSFITGSKKLLPEILSPESSFTPDQVAKFLVSGDTTVRLIDLRSPEEFKMLALPGSVNLPYNELITRDPHIYLNDRNIKNIFYSNDDLYSSYALVYTRGLGNRNSFAMKGGMNGWFEKVLESRFEGDRITPRENALYETRIKAARLFTRFNTLPDSLKTKFMATGKFSARKLDGGCE